MFKKINRKSEISVFCVLRLYDTTIQYQLILQLTNNWFPWGTKTDDFGGKEALFICKYRYSNHLTLYKPKNIRGIREVNPPPPNRIIKQK